MWVGNMEVRIEEYCTMMEPINNVDIAELVVIPKRKAGYMKGVVDIPFEFDLGRAKWTWNETYHGHTFGLHHNITVQLDRPWYTFDLISSTPISLERISKSPKESAGQVSEAGAANGQTVPHELMVPDFPGKLKMEYSIDRWVQSNGQ